MHPIFILLSQGREFPRKTGIRIGNCLFPFRLVNRLNPPMWKRFSNRINRQFRTDVATPSGIDTAETTVHFARFRMLAASNVDVVIIKDRRSRVTFAGFRRDRIAGSIP